MPCTNCHTINNNCGCNPQPCITTPCDCAAGYFSSDCTNNVKSIFSCLDIPSNLTLTETLEQMDAQICIKFNTVTNYSALINVGNGASLYKGVNNLGQKEIRKINKVGNLITVTENISDVSISIDELALSTFIVNSNFTIAAIQLDPSIGKNIYKNTTTLGGVLTLNFRSLLLESQGSGITLLKDLQENTNDIKIRTKSLKSDNGSVIITSTADEINFRTTPTGSSITTINDGVTTDVLGNGTTVPYTLEVVNLQKKINSSYTLQSSDNHYTIIVDATLGNIKITIPTGLVSKISVNFTQIGAGVVDFLEAGTVINTPTGLKIKGENFWANIYQRFDAPNTYQLAGAVIA